MRTLRFPVGRVLAVVVGVVALAVPASAVAASGTGSNTAVLPPGPSSNVTHPVDTNHTATFVATDSAGAPLVGDVVSYTVVRTYTLGGTDNFSGTCVTDATGQCSVTYHGPPQPALDFITAWTDANSNGVQDNAQSVPLDQRENTGYGGADWIIPHPGSTTVISPFFANLPVTMYDEVTFSVTYQGVPDLNVQVFYHQDGVNHSSDTCLTDANGQCGTLFGSSVEGLDNLTAWADANGNGTEDPGEELGHASVLWGPPVSNGKATGGGKAGGVTFSFTADAKNGPKGNCNVSDKTTKVDCTSVDSIVVTGSHATITGQATVNGVATTYTIDVDDNGDPGVGKDTFQIQTGTGYAAGGTITAGNVQVHK